MYYPDELVEEVRNRNNIVDVVGSYVRLQKKGSNYFGLCPFHNEKSPSFSVSSSKQIYYCFGCGAGGNVITFMMQYENMSFTEAMKELAEKAGIALPEREYTAQEKQTIDLKKTLMNMHKDAALFYFAVLNSKAGELGLEYFRKRGLKDETIKSFGLGYSPQSNGALYQYLKKKGYSEDAMKKSGLVRFSERGAMDNFWNRVMFPIMDVNNHVIAFGGRVMGDGEPKYLNSQETPIFDKSRNLYGLSAAKKSRKDYFLICEGYMDVISLHQAGFTNSVAALGTAFTPNHCSIIKRYVKKVVLTFDSDGAGIKAALRAIPILRSGGLAVKVLTMKPHKDPDEFIKNLGAEEYQKRIDEAEDAFLFQTDCLAAKYDFKDPQQKTTFQQEMAKMLLVFTDEMERNNYLEACSRKWNIDYNNLKKAVNGYALTLDPGPALGTDDFAEYRAIADRKKAQKDEGVMKSEKLILTWITEEPSIYEKVKKMLAPEDFSTPFMKKMAKFVMEQAENGEVNPGQILNSFINDEEEYNQGAALFQMKLSEELTESERNRAFRETIVRIKRNSLENQSKNADILKLQDIIKQIRALDQYKGFES